jgi:predicted N-acetyltransferase YhbS
MDVLVRALRLADVEAADRICQAAYRRSESREVELRRYLALPSSCWLLALDRGEPTGMVGAVSYGPFAYLGSMGVHPQAQRRGVGRTLMARILEWADGLGIPSVLLDATEEGAPLYASCGFVEMDRALLFRSEGAPLGSTRSGNIRPLEMADLEAVAAFDARYFGARREAVLHRLLSEFPDRVFACYDDAGQLTGYVVAQARRLGPWVARGAEEGEALLQAALPLSFASPPTAIVPEANAVGSALLARYGFRIVRACRHMWRGQLPAGRRRDRIYAQESFALG